MAEINIHSKGEGGHLIRPVHNSMLRFLKHLLPITASEAGRLGNQVKRERERERYKRFHDEMRTAQGKPKWEWME